MTERHEAYLYHVTFNAMHNLDINDPRKMHAHTFRVDMYVVDRKRDHPVFQNIEKGIRNYFDRYQGIRLNELPTFRDIVPTLENIGDIFYHELKPLFAENGMQLLSLEIGDSPISVYCIGERLLLGDISSMTQEGAVEGYCQRVRSRYEKVLAGENK